MTQRIYEFFLAVSVTVLPHTARAELPSADAVRQATGVRSGLAVVLGTTDGKLEAALAGDGKMLVQGLTLDSNACGRARQHLFEQQLYGVASVDCVGTMVTLPYYDMLINLLVADLDTLGQHAPSSEEINRVLGFDSVAYIKRNGTWTKVIRPMPKEADDFTHWAYDASRSNLSQDRLVGPPNALRWIGRPSDHNGYQGCRTAHGMVFLRSGSGQGNKSPEELKTRQPTRVFAKDAFSGVTLWEKVSNAGSRGIEWGVVGENRLFLFTTAPIRTSDGKPLPGSRGELLLEGWNIHSGDTELSIPLGKLHGDRESRDFLTKYLRCLPNLAVTEGRLMYNFGPEFLVRDEQSGDVIWQKDYSQEDGWVQSFMSADSMVVILLGDAADRGRGGALTRHHALKSLIGYRLSDGKEMWRLNASDLLGGTDFETPGAPCFVWELEGYGDGLLPLCIFRDVRGERLREAVLTLVDIKTGKQPWVARHQLKSTYCYYQQNKYIIGDRLYVGSLTHCNAFRMRDGTAIPEASWAGGPRSGNCCAGTATVRYLLLQRMFTPWHALATFDRTRAKPGLPDFWWARTFSLACRGRATPAYGTTYNVEGSCNCAVYISGSTALYGLKPTEEIADSARRQDAYPGSVAVHPLPKQTRAWDSVVATDWKMYPGRTAMCWSGPRTQHLANRAKGSIEVWGYGHNVTKPLRVGDLTIQGSTNEHCLTATRDGKPAWNFIAGGRIGARGELQTDGKRVYFGAHDSYVYAVNVNDGSLAWRFLAAPADRRMVAFGQVESSWPIFNVVLEDGKLYCCAGRHQDIDGGLHFWCLDAAEGEKIWHSCYKSGLPTEKQAHHLDNSPKTLYPTTYGMNNELTIEGDKLVLHGESCMPLKLNKNGFEDVIMNPDSLIPPEVQASPAP